MPRQSVCSEVPVSSLRLYSGSGPRCLVRLPWFAGKGQRMGDEDRDLQDPPQPDNSEPESSDSAASSLSLVSRDLRRAKTRVTGLESQVAFHVDQIENLQVQRASLERSVEGLEQRLLQLQDTEARLLDRIRSLENRAAALERQQEYGSSIWDRGCGPFWGFRGGYRRDMVLGLLRNCNPQTNAIRVLASPDGPR